MHEYRCLAASRIAPVGQTRSGNPGVDAHEHRLGPAPVAVTPDDDLMLVGSPDLLFLEHVVESGRGTGRVRLAIRLVRIG
jgi:hypothetical protein